MPGEGPHFAWVKHALAILAALLLTAPAFAQIEARPDLPAPEVEIRPETQDRENGEREGTARDVPPGQPRIVPIDPIPAPDLPPDASDLPEPDISIPEAPMPEIDAPDYSRLSSNEERAARLDELFARLAGTEEAEDGRLIAEEIWAIWTSSGSASVDLVLRRGSAAQRRGDNDLARRLYDHVTRLEPDHAEGWARSARLALEEEDYARAATETVEALKREPRHFYALWTLGNVLERLGRGEEALDAYKEANALYPSLENVAERVEALELRLGGSVL